MNSEMFEFDDDIFCTCSGTTTAKVAELVKRGIESPERIASITGANTGCGSCDVVLTDLIDFFKQTASETDENL